MIKQNEHRKTYSKEFKLMAVKMKLELGWNNKAIRQELKIPSPRMFLYWVKNYKTYGEFGLEEHRGKKSTGRSRLTPASSEQELTKRLHRLEMENEVLKKLLELQGRDVPPM